MQSRGGFSPGMGGGWRRLRWRRRLQHRRPAPRPRRSGRARRHVRRPLRRRRAAHRAPSSRARVAAPTSRARRRSGFTDALDGVTVSLRLTSDTACPTCQGTGGKPGTRPHICPECEGAGFVVAGTGGAFSINETCPACGGRQLVYDEACPTCHGSGRGTSARSIQARIPAGVKDGAKIRLKGKGAPGEQGGPAGDLFVTVKVTPHRVFGRKGDNLTLDVPVAFDEAALGGEVKIPTLGGAPVTLKLPPGTPNGRTFRVRGKGATQARRLEGRPARHRRGPGARPRSTRPRARPSRPTVRPWPASPCANGCSSDDAPRSVRPTPTPRCTSSAWRRS